MAQVKALQVCPSTFYPGVSDASNVEPRGIPEIWVFSVKIEARPIASPTRLSDLGGGMVG